MVFDLRAPEKICPRLAVACGLLPMAYDCTALINIAPLSSDSARFSSQDFLYIPRPRKRQRDLYDRNDASGRMPRDHWFLGDCKQATSNSQCRKFIGFPPTPALRAAFGIKKKPYDCTALINIAPLSSDSARFSSHDSNSFLASTGST